MASWLLTIATVWLVTSLAIYVTALRGFSQSRSVDDDERQNAFVAVVGGPLTLLMIGLCAVLMALSESPVRCSRLLHWLFPPRDDEPNR